MVELGSGSLRYTPRIVPSVHRLTRQRVRSRSEVSADDVAGFGAEVRVLDDSSAQRPSPEQQPMLAKAG